MSGSCGDPPGQSGVILAVPGSCFLFQKVSHVDTIPTFLVLQAEPFFLPTPQPSSCRAIEYNYCLLWLQLPLSTFQKENTPESFFFLGSLGIQVLSVLGVRKSCPFHGSLSDWRGRVGGSAVDRGPEL